MKVKVMCVCDCVCLLLLRAKITGQIAMKYVTCISGALYNA